MSLESEWTLDNQQKVVGSGLEMAKHLPANCGNGDTGIEGTCHMNPPVSPAALKSKQAGNAPRPSLSRLPSGMDHEINH